jgi:hypothetical protein
VRLLVGTRKGAFVLTSDGTRDDWNVEGPLFAGWEIYHLNGSPVDPDRLYASQSSGWHGQVMQRSDDGGKSWQPVGNEFAYGSVARRAVASGRAVHVCVNGLCRAGTVNRRGWLEPRGPRAGSWTGADAQRTVRGGRRVTPAGRAWGEADRV